LFRFASVIKIILIILVAELSSISVFASTDYKKDLLDNAKELELSSNPYWYSLVHYKQTLFGGFESQADDPRFFLATNGKTSPDEELIATINAFFIDNVDGDHPQCRFPARYFWLKKNLNFNKSKLIERKCAELDNWAQEIKPGTLTLIFPAAYINGPSSMFGHTLLRVNPSDYRKNSPLISYALNYAANANTDDNALTFTYKGMFGGYPGVFSIVPYYEKIKEYSDFENRDIWEYSLNYTQQEVEQLMRHAWEVRNITFDYYFLTENCSYHMLSLMEVARPGLDLTSQFDMRAIPADTVRAVVDQGIVTEVQYRPSSTTVIKSHALELTEEEINLTIELARSTIAINNPIIASMNAEKQSRIFEQAYDYSRYLASDDAGVRDSNAKNNWELLAARSEHDMVGKWDPVYVPDTRSDQSHRTRRLSVGIGEYDDESYLSVKLRPAYHDVLDPPDGYSKGAQINFGDIRFKYFKEDSRFELDKFIILNVLSLTAINDYFNPFSWGADWSVERVSSRQGRINAMSLTVVGGYSFSLNNNLTMSTLLEMKALTANSFDKSYSGGLGPIINILYQSSNNSTQVNLKSLSYRAGEEDDFKEAGFEQAFHFGHNQSLRISFIRTFEYERYITDVEMSVVWFF